MSFIVTFILIQLNQVCFSFRSFQTDFNKEIFQRSCPSYHQYWPDIYPYMCAGVPRECADTTQLRNIIVNNHEVLCHPQVQGYILYPKYDTHIQLGWWPFVMIYSYDSHGNLIFTTEAISSLNAHGCLIGQKYSGIYKCIYCAGYNYGQNCATTPTPPGKLSWQSKACGQFCKTCDATNTKCASCIPGQSSLDSNDLQCTLTCQPSHKTCQQLNSVYSFSECKEGYEFINSQCVQCPINCKVCSSGVCSECMWPYTLQNSLCFEDRNCMQYDYIYDSNGEPIATNCNQCDVGYFKRGIRCSSCQNEPGLEKCFTCHNASECKSCFATHILTPDKKCVLYTVQCNAPCQTCLITDPNYCTTCFYDNKLSARVIPGQCVCDQVDGYTELNGECVLCTLGYCYTCTLTFGDCTSCDPLRNRTLIGNTCPCQYGYFDTGLEDKICQQCYPSCYNCSGPFDNDCTECGDPNIYNKLFVDGKCICAIRTIEITQINGPTLCQPCHTRCEKCLAPADNTSNQYCTMCIAGQNRVVSDDLKCICKSGYGEDGIQVICFKCHYSCLRCNGPLSNNCTECSSENHRYLTSDNKCSCDPAYYDSGRNEVFCYFSCHHSCTSCIIAAVDSCTACPSTRKPDRVGSTFQCLCKDSHYYSVQSQLKCLECHFTCKTCNGGQKTNCLTCELTYRQLIISKCDCPFGYYNVGLLQCEKCHYTCKTCYGPEFDNCISCPIDSNRATKGNLCPCKDGYLEKIIGGQMCIKCSYRCASCSGTINNCDTCPEFSFRTLGADNSCSCPPKYFDQLENPICTVCHNTCLTCNGSQSNQCKSCNSLIGRALNNQGECKCAPKYFDVGQIECQACSNTCYECTTSSLNCTSCQPEKYLDGNTCLCKTKLQGWPGSTYQNKLSCACSYLSLKIACYYARLTCTSRSTGCDSCWDQDKRIKSGTNCICQTNYYDVGKAKCSQCNFRCQNCAVLDSQCLSCPPESLRVLIQSQCLCQSGYYDDGINIICQKCHYSCLTCYQISTKCDSCSTTANRQLNNIINSCFCIDQYYDKGVEVCEKCYYSCFNCQGQDSNQCKTCTDSNISFRVYNGGTCQCLLGYFDDGSSANCKKCSIKCSTCQSQPTYCTSCTFTRHLNGIQCDCDSGYYEIGQEKCSKCDSNCINCTINSTTCTSCDSSELRVLNNLSFKCQCQNGTTEINGVCQYCDIACQTCLNTVTNCTSCGQMKQLQNKTCICIQGTFETGIDKKCQLCDKTCLTCMNQANYCLTCSEDNFRILRTGNICVYSQNQCILCDQSCLTCQSNSKFCLSCDPAFNLILSNQNKCICPSSYYFNTSIMKCEACNITCKECQSVSQCIECEPITRYYDGITFQCLCKQGFYETYQRYCQQCDITCKTCINQSTKCLTCESQYFRIIQDSNKCLCLDGYFDVGIEICQKCNDLCKTCISKSSQCLSCYETEQIRILNNNTCICKSGYFDNGQLICEKCSKSCLTCQGKYDYCTSCDINMNRIDQSAIHKCPCQTNVFQDENEVCQKCHIKCSGCIQKADKCISCKPSNTSNRLTITQNCDCKDGYYDDGILFQCQKCNYPCKTCIQSSSNCLICLSNLREGAPACNCKSGFFSNEQQTCEPCDNKCSTCEQVSSNCTACRGNRINKTCDCLVGYYEVGQLNCIQCDFQCLVCKENQSNCLLCRGNRINTPACNCQDGFYDDYQSFDCLECDQNCKTCNLEGCLTCYGNRVLSEENTCDCPLDSISHTDTQWCSNCEVAVLDIIFSDDLLSIQVLFDFSLNRNYFSSQLQENICFKFLADETIKKLGKNPECKLDQVDNKKIILKLGSNPNILPGDSIIFINYSIGHNNCQRKLGQFIFNQVKVHINLLQPIIDYEIPQYLLNPFDENIISVKSRSQHGLRNMINITWSFLLIGQNGNANLEDFVLQQTNLQQLDLNIPIQTLPKESQITFVVEFQNFIKQKGTQQIQVQTHSGQLPTILWQGKKQLYTFEIISLYFKIQKKFCSDSGQIQNLNSQYEISLAEIYKNNSKSNSSKVNVSQTVSDNYFEVKIKQYTLSPNTAYTFKMEVGQAQTNFSSSQYLTIEILQGGLQCQFYNTKKIQNYRKDSIVNIYCKDLDAQYQWNEDPEITIEVSCADLTKNTYCTNSNNTIFQINKTDSVQIIPKQSVNPFTIWGWSVIASKTGLQYEFKYNIVFLDNDFQFLDVSYSKGYTMRPINSYETLQFDFNISFEDRQYLLQQQIVIIYDFEVIKILEPQYFSCYFRLFDQYQQFNKGNQFNLKFLAQLTNDIIPRQYDLQLNLNQPPICQIKLGSQTLQALQTSKIVANCYLEEDSPFTYQLRFFLNNQDYKDFQKQLSDFSLILNSFQQSNAFEIYLPNCEGVVLIQVMDSRGSITNIESYQNVTKFKLNCSDFAISNLNYKQKIILLLEVMMNHYGSFDCVQFSEQLFKQTISLVDSDDLSDQLLVLSTLKLYKRFIMNFNNVNSSKRNLGETDQGSCYDNKTKLILFNNSKVYKYFSADIITFTKELDKLKNFTKKIILTKTDLEYQIQQNDIFMNELLFQFKQSISNSLDSLIQYIDDLYTKISQTSIRSDTDQDQILLITENLNTLIDDIAPHIGDQVQVNGQQLTLNGQQLKYQIAKISKYVFNQQLGLENDIMDSLIVFVKKEQLEIHFNYLNISKKHTQEVQRFLNSSQLEIDQQYYAKTKLQNYLYKKQYISYEFLNANYVVDVTEYSYCNQTSLPAYNFQCVQYSDNGALQLCNILIQESNLKQSIQISCSCQYMGIIFLTRELNQTQNSSEFFQISIFSQDANCGLHNQPFLLFHGIYIIFSLFMYYELQRLERLKLIETLCTQGPEKKNTIRFYNYWTILRIYKTSIKFIHEIICLFYSEDRTITKSYRFLKFSIILSILIPLTFFETFYMDKEYLTLFLIINYLLLLLFRMIFKIFEAIYRFKGKCQTFVVIVYLIIHFSTYSLLIFQYQNRQIQKVFRNKCSPQFNYNMLILLGSTIIFSYAFFDLILIFLRIILYVNIASIIKINQLDPLKQFIYFFIKQYKLVLMNKY